MSSDEQRIERMKNLMKDHGLDALACVLPRNVLMLSGYYPALGQSIAIMTAEGNGALIAPASELPFAQDGWFQNIRTFETETPDFSLTPTDVSLPLLAEVCCEMGISNGVIGIDESAAMVAAPYPEFLSPGCTPRDRWAEVMPLVTLRDASAMLDEAASIKTAHEIERIELASKLAEYGFQIARELIRPGSKEIEAAAAARSTIEVRGTGHANVRRVTAWASCVSGRRSGDAYRTYQLSTNKRLEPGDSVVVEIICGVDGFYTKMTRTFFVGRPHDTILNAYNAALEAWQRAFSAIAEGRKASDVDHTARSFLNSRDYDGLFPRGLGHGVGFSTLDHGQLPVIHPKSLDVLADDMVFSISPGVFVIGDWGVCLSDVVSVRGAEGKTLSDLRRDTEWALCG